MVERIKRGEGAFSKGKGLFSPESLPKSSDGKGGFVSMGKAIDFAEFRKTFCCSLRRRIWETSSRCGDEA